MKLFFRPLFVDLGPKLWPADVAVELLTIVCCTWRDPDAAPAHVVCVYICVCVCVCVCVCLCEISVTTVLRQCNDSVSIVQQDCNSSVTTV
jgi:hypothetical protein